MDDALYLIVNQKPDDDDHHDDDGDDDDGYDFDDNAYACSEGFNVPAQKLSLVKVLVLCGDKQKNSFSNRVF